MSVRSTPAIRSLSFLATVATAVLIACNGSQGSTDTQRPTQGSSAPSRPAPSGPVAAYVGDAVITADEVRERIQEQSAFLQQRYREDARSRLSLVDTLVRQELLAQEAFRRGLDQDPKIQAKFKQILVQEMIKRVFDAEGLEFTEEEMREYYDRRIDDFVRPERVRALHVFIAGPSSDPAKRAEGRRKAQELLARIRANEARADVRHPEHSDYSRTLFGDIAREHSDDVTTKAVSGDLRPLTQDQLSNRYGEEFAKSVFALQRDNQVSGLIETPRGFHIAKRVQRQAAQNRQFEDPEVQEAIRDRLFRERRTKAFDDFIQDLREKSNVRIDEDVLAGIEIPTGGPPAAVGTPQTPPVAGTDAN